MHLSDFLKQIKQALLNSHACLFQWYLYTTECYSQNAGKQQMEFICTNQQNCPQNSELDA